MISQHFNGDGRQSPLSYFRRFVALATAQHYGLPSSGLDLTHDLDVALYFALHRFGKGSGEFMSEAVPTDWRTPPVLYVFRFVKRQHFVLEEFLPRGLNFLRPFRQGARFLDGGWGLHRNQSARYLLIEFVLDRGDYSHATTTHLFPQQDEDGFGRYLQEIANAKFSGLLGEFMRHFRWVVSG